MKDQSYSSVSRKPLLIGLSVFLLISFLTQYLAFQKYQLDEDTNKNEVLQELGSVKNRIKNSLAYELSATKTLAFIVEKYGIPEDFDKLAKQILESNKTIDALELTQKGVITHVYPLEENKTVIGFDVLKDSLRNQEAFKAIEYKEFYVAGPFELKQGGIGFVGRVPIFKDNQFWGFSAVLIKLSTFLKEAGIVEQANSRFYYQLSKLNSVTKKEEFFLPHSSLFDKCLSASIGVENGSWKISVTLKNDDSFFNAVIISLLGLGISLVCGFLAWSKAREPEKLKELVMKKTVQLAASEKHFRSMIEKSADAIVLLDKEGKTFYQTPSAEKISGYSLSDIQAINGLDIIHPDDREADAYLFKYLLTLPGTSIRRNHRMKHKDGHYMWIEGTYTNLLNDENIRAIIYNYYDISQRIASEEKAALANRLYEVISRINRVMIDVTDEKTLFNEVCKIAVTYGKFKMAWIGLINEAEQRLVPVTHAGEEKDYLGKIKSITIDDQELNAGPTGQAVRSGTYVFCNDIKNDPGMQPWAEEALARDFQSSITLPIKKFGKIIGTFSLYASITDYFNLNEIALLEETTGDISFALESLENEKLRREAEEQIEAEKILSESIINSLPGIFYFYDKNGKFIRWNKNFETISGYSGREISYMHPLDFYDFDEKKYIENKIRLVFEKGRDEVEASFMTKTGQKIPYYFNGYRVVFNGKAYLIGMGLDITERKKIETELKENEEKYRLLFNKSPIAAWMLSIPSYNIIDVNDTAIKTYGYSRDEFLKLNASSLRSKDDPGKFEKEMVPLEWTENAFVGKWNHMKKNGEILTVEVIMHDFTYRNEHVRLVLANDVTDRERAENELRESEARLADAQILAKIGNWEIDLSSQKMIWSAEVYRIFERDPKTMESVTGFLNFIHPDDFERVNDVFTNSLNKTTLNSIEYRILTPNGTIKTVEERWRISFDEAGKPHCATGTCQDITDRKQAEALIQESQTELRKLYTYLQTVREEERTGIAREIHDELGQQLTALKMDSFWIMKKLLPEDLALKEKLTGMISLIDETIKTVRRIASELRPGILDDLGLLAAIEWQGQEFEKRTGIKSVFKSMLTNFNPGKDLSTHIFRVFQEGLTNIVRHAHASSVETTIGEKDGFIWLVLKDNGIGFDMEEAKNKNSLGLLGMKERALLFNGELLVESEEAKGTQVTLKIPSFNINKRL